MKCRNIEYLVSPDDFQGLAFCMEPNYDGLARQVLESIAGDLPDELQSVSEICQYFRQLMNHLSKSCLTFYVCPLGGVEKGETGLREFLLQSRRLQRTWIRQLNQVLGHQQVKHHYRAVDPIIRQLELTGLLVINGKHVFPNQWPDAFKADNLMPSSLVGQRFGRLTVISAQSKKCDCLCECGKPKSTTRGHLLTGRVKSCGCLRDEKIEFYACRKFQRSR